jgi:hypothetical protein
MTKNRCHTCRNKYLINKVRACTRRVGQAHGGGGGGGSMAARELVHETHTVTGKDLRERE